MIALSCEKYNHQPCDVLFPGERNPFFRLAVNILALQIQNEYETLATELHKLEHSQNGNSPHPDYETDPNKMRDLWRDATQRVG